MATESSDCWMCHENRALEAQEAKCPNPTSGSPSLAHMHAWGNVEPPYLGEATCSGALKNEKPVLKLHKHVISSWQPYLCEVCSRPSRMCSTAVLCTESPPANAEGVLSRHTNNFKTQGYKKKRWRQDATVVMAVGCGETSLSPLAVWGLATSE